MFSALSLQCRFIRSTFGSRFAHTIYALSSGFGKCGVAVIRISGPNAQVALTKMCKRLPPPRRAQLEKIRNPDTDEVLDHGLVLWFPGPASFTGEDCCEFQVHGGSAVLTSIFSSLAKFDNFRPAEPGEFARRAFYGGKLDLTSIEGLGDLINAETEYQRKQAVIQMEGALCQIYTDWRNSLSKCLANIEAYIDFDEDQDIESTVMSDAASQIEDLCASMKKHLSDGRKGERLRSGVNMTIIGAPNVGKSTLMNAMSKKPVAIVSDIPGTTRDIIKVDLDLCGFPVNVQDTAGLRSTSSDVIELEGINRAKKALNETHFLIIVVDAQRISSSHQSDVRSALMTHLNSLGVPRIDEIVNDPRGTSLIKYLIIVNKIDLVDDKTNLRSLKDSFESRMCLLSCKTNDGMEDLMELLSSHLEELCGNPSAENPCFSQPRHRFCLEESAAALTRFSSYSEVEIDLAAQEVRNALHCLGKITGHVSTEDILDIIFKDFCIGK